MSGLAEIQARQIVRQLHQLRNEVDIFATHARMLRLSSKSIDALVLLQEADNLLRGLKANRIDFQNATSHVASLSRSLSSRPPAAGGPPPAAQWGSEFRALSKQFVTAMHNAEKELSQLYGAADAQLNSPTRTATAPDNLIDVLLTFIDGLSRFVEFRRRKRS